MKNVPTINVIFKTFRLVELLCEPNSEYSMTEFSKELNMSVGSVQRITNSLVSLGYLSKNPKTKKYKLTHRWLPVGFSILASLEIRKTALQTPLPMLPNCGRSVEGDKNLKRWPRRVRVQPRQHRARRCNRRLAFRVDVGRKAGLTRHGGGNAPRRARCSRPC